MTAPAPDPLLEAARGVFEQFGVRRATMEDVARAAGVSRSTLYRAHPTKEALLLAVVERETAAFFDHLEEAAADLPPGEAVVECFVRGIALMREIPVLGRLAQTEPEVVTGMPGRGSLVLRFTERVAATLRRAGATMPDDELLEVAELLLRLASTYLLDPTGRLDVTDERAVRAYAARFLAVLVH
ncbi:helix-turn-helix domain-containing protein [Nocardioides nanhaiensis]|uniref:Helix-turn-helix domain-containing protein n=1 Tax=Nocardioides nanhaiensis TaxID=1476871 RepID=A0ABP8WWI8_9ACTN